VQGPILGASLARSNLNRTRVDVWVQKEGENAPSFLLGDLGVARFSGAGTPVNRVTLQTDSNQFARLSQARADGVAFILERHPTSPFAPLWSTPPVSGYDFRDVGHSWFGLLWAWIGGWLGRYFYATRDRGP
jgi:hypothetical protein